MTRTSHVLLILSLWLGSPLIGCDTRDDDSGDDDTGDDDTGDDDAGDDDSGDDDAGDDDSSTAELWPWCPGAGDAVTDSSWEQSLVVTDDALYCATFKEYTPLSDDLARKALMRVVPGTYPLPHDTGGASLALPHCFQLKDAEPPPLLDGAGDVYTSNNEFLGDYYFTHQLEQPLLTDSSERHWLVATIIMDVASATEGPAPLVLDGSGPQPFGGAGYSFRLCPDNPQNCGEGRDFVACDPQSYTLQRHTVLFEGGEVRFDIRMGKSMAATEPAAFVRAEGQLDGTAFEVDDYWRLLYSPTHHHFSRDFGVLFDAPIGAACGLKAANLDPWSDPPDAVIHTIDCEANEVEERAVTSESYELP